MQRGGWNARSASRSGSGGSLATIGVPSAARFSNSDGCQKGLCYRFAHASRHTATLPKTRKGSGAAKLVEGNPFPRPVLDNPPIWIFV